MTSIAVAFDPRKNAIGFLRWLMAFMVIFSHAGPIAGFYGGQDLGSQWSDEQSLGGVAVCGFFFLSGFLITRSKMGRSSTPRFFWHRLLRIYPGYFFILLLTAYVFAPLAWVQETGGWDGFWNADTESPFTYFSENFTLLMHQLNIAGMGTSTPLYTGHGILDWNGSAWTLAYEFAAYIMVGALGVFGALANRLVGGLVAGAIILLSTMQWMGFGDLVGLAGVFSNFRFLLLFAPFAWGMLFQLFKDRIPVDDRLAVLCMAVALLTYAKGGWLVIGQYAFCYALIWFAIRATKLSGWDRHADLSYGIYISGWPIMWLATYFHLEQAGWLVYHLVVIAAVHVYGYLSWHLIEKPAMSLKSWTPRWLTWIEGRARPAIDRARSWIGARTVITRPEAGR